MVVIFLLSVKPRVLSIGPRWLHICISSLVINTDATRKMGGGDNGFPIHYRICFTLRKQGVLCFYVVHSCLVVYCITDIVKQMKDHFVVIKKSTQSAHLMWGPEGTSKVIRNPSHGKYWKMLKLLMPLFPITTHLKKYIHFTMSSCLMSMKKVQHCPYLTKNCPSHETWSWIQSMMSEYRAVLAFSGF